VDSLQTALQQIHEIESAVAQGDLELADSAVQSLKPMLVSKNIDDLLALRSKIEKLTIGVKALRDDGATSLLQLKLQRGGAAAYQQMQSHR
jgi:hypothetical protein